ncbi:hypothetical protein OAB00_02670 [Akkermansiaceae bacterium]|nr:hypothetical protein [Akkermansiaceae bacterium]
MMKKSIITLASTLCFGASLLSAETKISPNLADIAKKVDTDGEFLQLQYEKNDISMLNSYVKLLTQALKDSVPGFPQDVDAEKFLKLSGILDREASATSTKKVDGAWNHTTYVYNGGSTKGIYSMYGDSSHKITIADFAPKNVDVAAQMKLDLRQIKVMLEEIAKQSGQQEKALKELNTPMPQMAGMSALGIIEKANLTVNFLGDLDSTKANSIYGFDGVAIRIDDASWLWEVLEPMVVEGTQLPWVKSVEGAVTTLTLPEDAQAEMMGYSLTVRVDENHIWFASKESFLNECLSTEPKLASDEAYISSMKSLPQEGNWMFYMTSDAQAEIMKQVGKVMDEEGAYDIEEFNVKSLMEKLTIDLTESKTPIAMVLDVDDKGVKTVIRSQFPIKNYIQQILPQFLQVAQYAVIGAGF